MFKTQATNVIISKGYDGADAFKFSEKGDAVRFRIGQKVYDKRAENNQRWMNISVKAFGDLCERIRKMKLKEGSFVNISGRLDEEKWNDANGVARSTHVIILDDIEYAYIAKNGENGGSGQGQNQNQGAPQGNPQYAPQGNPQYAPQQNGGNPQYAPQQNGGNPQYAPQGNPQYPQPQNGGEQTYQQTPQNGGAQIQQFPQPGMMAAAAGAEGFTGFEPYSGPNMFG